MGWLWSADCTAAWFAWHAGIASGLYAIILATIMVVTAPAYHPDVRRAYSAKARNRVQWVLTLAPYLLLALWLAGAWHFWMQLSCYVWNLSIGMLLTLAPLVLLFLFTAAQWIGRAGAR